MALKSFSGAYADIIINGKKVGYATNVSGTERVGYTEVNVMGELPVKERVPTNYTASITVGFVCVDTNELRALGIFPDPTDVNNYFNAEPFTLAVKNSPKGKVIWRAMDCNTDGVDWTGGTGNVFTKNVTIGCRYIQSESQI